MNKHRHFHSTLFFLLIILLAGGQFVSSAFADDSAETAVFDAWQRTQKMEGYQYDSTLQQTDVPLPRLENIGRSPRTQTLFAEGAIEATNNLLYLNIWDDGNQIGNRENALQVKVEDGQAYSRIADADWQALDSGVADIFAPDQDTMGYLVAAENITLLEQERRGGIAITRYAFDLNGPQLAANLRDIAMREMRERGELPPGMQLQAPDKFMNMTGNGELWLDEAGLPLRQTIFMQFSPEGDNRQEVEIRTDYRQWQQSDLTGLAAKQYELTRYLNNPTVAEQWQRTAVFLSLFLFTIWLVANYSRRRWFHRTLVSVIIIVMLVGPLLQVDRVSAFYEKYGATEPVQNTTAITPPQETPFNPQQNPLTVTSAATTAPLADDPTDSDGDGLSNVLEQRLGSDINNSDSDGDGLPDGIEYLQLGTSPVYTDTDGDMLSDLVEVNGYQDGGGQWWYTDPNHPDSNRDGIVDGVECPQLRENPATACIDTDNDGIPDFADRDNDNDGVPDKDDLDMNLAMGGVRDGNGQIQGFPNQTFDFDLTQMNVGQLYETTFQFRPVDASRLWYNMSVFDWPGADYYGNVQRADNNTTFQDIQSQSSSADANGDVRLMPMLEIEIPYQSGSYGGLPTINNPAPLAVTNPITSWLDIDKATEYGLTVNYKSDTDASLLVYAPIVVNLNNITGDPVAFSAQMPYWPQVAALDAPHKIRLTWVIQAINNRCDEFTQKDGAIVGCENWSADQVQVIQSYSNDDWYLTGLEVKEDLGARVAIIYESAPSNQPDYDAASYYEREMWGLYNGLEMTFVDGRVENNQRFDLTEIARRFDITNTATITERWGIDTPFAVNIWDFPQSNQILDIAMTHTRDTLNANFGGTTAVDDYVALTFASEFRSRSALLSSGSSVVVAAPAVGGLITDGMVQMKLNAADIVPQTIVNLRWSPFQNKGAGEWLAQSPDLYLDYVRNRVANNPAELDALTTAVVPINDLNAADGFDILDTFYYVRFVGTSNMVELGGISLPSPTPVDDTLLQSMTVGGGTVGTVAKAVVDWVDFAADFKEAGNAFNTKLKFDLVGGGLAGSAAGFSVVATFATVAGEENIADVLNTIKDVVDLIDTGRIVVQSFNNAKSASDLYKALSAAVQVSGKAAAIAAIITVAVVLVIFLLAAAFGDVEFFGVGFNQALIQGVIASLIVAVLFILLSATGVGAIIVAVIGGIDALIGVACQIVDWVDANATDNAWGEWICGGITGALTKSLGYTLYDQAPLLDMQNPNRLQFTSPTITLVDPLLGFTQNNQLAATMALTSTLYPNDPWLIYGQDIFGKESNMRRTTLRYELTLQEEYDDEQFHIRAGIDTEQMSDEWISASAVITETRLYITDTVSTTIPLLNLTGINQALPLYLAEGKATATVECIPAGAIIATDFSCWQNDERETEYTNLGERYQFDIFPATLAEFVSLTRLDGYANGYAPLWSQTGSPAWPIQADADGDGLRSPDHPTMPGNDPNDSDPDSDDDTLSDFYEVKYNSDPLNPDTDGDGLSDAEEVYYGTNPRLADSDLDGLSDGEEIAGWAFVYQYDPVTGVSSVTWVTSDPLAYDTDGDELTDRQEKTYGFNPRVYSSDAVLSILATMSDEDGYVAPGDVISYTAVISNETTSRQARGLLTVEFPAAVQNNTLDPKPFILDAAQSATLTGTLTIDPLAVSQGLTLTNRAGAVLVPQYTDQSLWLKFNEDNPTSSYFDSSRPQNAVSCSLCPDVAVGYQTNSASFNGIDDVLTVSDPDLLGLNGGSFTVMGWVKFADKNPGVLLTTGQENGGWSEFMEFSIVDGRPQFAINTGGTTDLVSPPISIPPNDVWYHMAWRYDGNTNALTLFQDGVSLMTTTLTQQPTAVTITDAFIGDGPIEGFLAGKLDNLEIYPTALSDTDIAQQVLKPAVHLNFEDSAATTDLYGNAVDAREATMNQGDAIAQVAGVDGQAANLDGRHNFYLQDTPSARRDAFTHAFWVYPRDTVGLQGIAGNSAATQISDLDGSGFSLNGSASIFIEDGVRLVVGFGDGVQFRTAVSDDILQPNEWSHIVLTYGEDGVPQYKVYVNGRYRQTLVGTFAAAAQNPTMPAYIGSATQQARITYYGSYIYQTIFDGGGNNEFYYLLDDDHDPNNNVGSVRLNRHGGVSDGNTWIAANPADSNDNSDPDRLYSYQTNLVAYEDDGVEWFGGETALTDDWLETEPSYYDFDITIPSFDNELIFTDRLTDSLKSEFIFGWRPLIDIDDDDPGVLNIVASHTNPSQPFNGNLDDFREYHRALNGDEAAILYNLAQPTGIRFNLDEPPASDEFADASGSLVVGSCDWAADSCPISGISGLWNQMALFGSQPVGDTNPNDYISLPATAVNMTGQSYTIAAWVNGRDYAGATRPIFGADNPDSPRLAIVNGYPVFSYGNPKDVRNVITGTTQLVENNWDHLAVRYNAGNLNGSQTDWANGATATIIDGSGAENVLDGNVSTKALSSSTTNAWLRIDLGAVRQLRNATIRFASDDSPSSGAIRLYETNGGPIIWQTTIDFTDLQELYVPSVYGRYLEIQLDGSASDPLEIYTVEANGPEDYAYYELLVNGQIEGTIYTKSPGSYSYNALYLGRAKEPNNAFYQYYRGYLDQVKIYNEFKDINPLLWDVPVLYLRFDEQSQPATTEFINSVAGLPHASNAPVICWPNYPDLRSCPTAGPTGRFSRSVLFSKDDGTSDDSLETNLTNRIQDEVTISAWVKGIQGGIPSGKVMQIVTTNGATLYLDAQIDRNGLPTFDVNGGSALTYLITDTLKPNQWYHIVWRRSLAEGERAIFVNGQKIATGDAGTRPGGGKTAIISDSRDNFTLFAQLDELSLHRIAFTDNEIGELYDYQVGWYEVAYDNRVVIDAEQPTLYPTQLPEFLPRQDVPILLAITADDLGLAGDDAFASGIERVAYRDSTSVWSDAVQDGNLWILLLTPDTTGVYQNFRIQAWDWAGNTTTVDPVITVDGTLPTVAFSSVTMNEILDTTVISGQLYIPLSGTASDNSSYDSGVARVRVRLVDYLGQDASGIQTAVYNAGVWQLDYPLLAGNLTGVYTATVTAVDFAGNVMTKTAVLQIDSNPVQAWMTDIQLGTAPVGFAQRVAAATSNTSVVSSPIITYSAGTPITMTGIMLDAAYPTNATLYAPFEEASFDGQVLNASFNHNTFACNSCPSPVTGAIGQGADFDGTTDITAVQSQVNLNQLTAAFWLKTSSAAVGDQTLLASGNTLDIYRIGGGDQIGFTTETDSGNRQTLVLTNTLPANTWTHLAFVYDGTAKQIYVNGRPATSVAMSGMVTISDTMTVGTGLVGQMDELLLYQQAWPTTLIDQMYTLVGREAQQIEYALVLREENAPPISSFNWQTATIATTVNDPLGRWTAPLLNPNTGWYQIFLRTTDGRGRQQTSRVWEGGLACDWSVVYVDGNAAGLANGRSWDDAFLTVQDALALQSYCPDAEIWVAAGTYYPDEGSGQVDNDRDSTFQLKDGVTVYGGFIGTEELLNERDWEANVTIFSGDLDKNDAGTPAGGNAWSVVTGNGTDETAVLDGFTIQDGLANGSSLFYTQVGAGILNNNGSPTMRNLIITNNEASYAFGTARGAGVYNYTSSSLFSTVVISGNIAAGSASSSDGAGMYNDSSNPTLNDVVFLNNIAAHDGGGLYNEVSSPQLTTVTFQSNRAGRYGGGAYNANSPAVMTGVIFRDNSAASRGGGVYNAVGSAITISNALFVGNYAQYFGGGMMNDNSNPILTNVTISGNWAENCTNLAPCGGGIFNLDGSPVVRNSIIWNNRERGNVGTAGSGIMNFDLNGTSIPTIGDSLVQGSGGSGSWNSGVGTDLGGNIDSDPFFLSPVAPDVAPTVAGDYQLNINSPAADAANNLNCSATDLLGVSRPQNGICDMGAYEAVYSMLTVNLGGDGGGSVTSVPSGIDCGVDCTYEYPDGTVVTLTAVPSTTATFIGWSGGITTTINPITLTMDAAKSVTATFTLDQYALTTTTDGSGAGSVSLNPAGGVYDYGTAVTVTQSANTGSTFAGWSGACSGNGNCVVTMDAAKSVTATFTLDQYALTTTTDGSGAGLVSLNPAGGVYDYGTAVTVTHSANTGSTFTGWSGACAGTGDCVVIISQSSVVTATFTLGTTSLTVLKDGTGGGVVNSSPNGIDCGVTCSNVFSYGTVVTLTAIADIGSTFIGWSDACSGMINCVITIDAAKSVTATFETTSYTIFLPVVINNSPRGADLIVETLLVDGSQIEVTIKNVGDTPVTDPFWVDLYIDPTTPPTAVNQTILTLNSDGAVWGVNGAALPLQSGESLLLTLYDVYFDAGASRLNLPVLAGTAVYAQVDSAGTVSYGGVYESHEQTGEVYNNISIGVAR